MSPPPLATREAVREQLFSEVWTRDLNTVFADVAPYYDQANYVDTADVWWFIHHYESHCREHGIPINPKLYL